jgi:tetratricopeptide (TPR) repeat protein
MELPEEVCQAGSTFHLADDRVKRAVGVLRRAEIAQACVRLSGDAFQQRRREPGLADPGLAGEEHHLAFTSLCPRPPPQQQFEFFFPPYQLRQTAASQWKALAVISQGCALALTGNASDAVQILTSGIAALRSTGATWGVSFYLSCLARAYADLGQFDDAWRCIGEAMTAVETTKEKWCEADIHRIAGEIVLLSPELNAAKAEAYFERALAVARKQQAKSWELRAAMSMARLLRDQGKWAEARDLLAPVYGWFTEGFDTLDLKEAKALLGELAKLH